MPSLVSKLTLAGTEVSPVRVMLTVALPALSDALVLGALNWMLPSRDCPPMIAVLAALMLLPPTSLIEVVIVNTPAPV